MSPLKVNILAEMDHQTFHLAEVDVTSMDAYREEMAAALRALADSMLDEEPAPDAQDAVEKALEES